MAVTTQYFGSRFFIKNYDHDPGATTAVLASPDGGTTPISVDLNSYHRVAISYRPTIVGGAGVTLVRIMASTDSAGATNATVIKTSGAVAGDSLNDTVFLECNAEEVAQIADAAGVSLRYLTFEITHGTSTDEGNLTVIAEPRFPRDALSATAIT